MNNTKAFAVTASDNEQKNSEAAKSIARALPETHAVGAVLDVGCGTAELLLALQARSTALSGVDLRTDFLEIAKSRLPCADIRLANIEHGLPFSDASFDTILFCDVIEHLQRPVEALRELRRLLRPGGIVLLTTPNSNSMVRKLTGRGWFALQDPSHLIFYTRFSLRHLMRKVGFETISTRAMGLTGNVFIDWLLQAFGDGGTLVVIATRG